MELKIKTDFSKYSKEELIELLEKSYYALKEIIHFNDIRNDYDMYQYEVALYGVNAKKRKPKREDFGITN